MAHCPLDSIETKDCVSFHCQPFYYAYGDESLIASLYHDTLIAVLIFTVFDLKVNKTGDGGVVMDSDTTFTMLSAGFYDYVVAEFDRHVGKVNPASK
jgi:hypothetical protein